VVDQTEMKDDLVQDMMDVLTSFCARLYGLLAPAWIRIFLPVFYRRERSVFVGGFSRWRRAAGPAIG